MNYLIDRLIENDKVLISANSLFNSFREAVIRNSDGQVPQYGDIQKTGDEGGDFIFVLK